MSRTASNYLLLTLGCAVALALALHHKLAWPAITSWLLAINLVTVSTYAHDKARARNNHWRVPESVLLLLGFIGGTVSALFGMFLFRHKISKASFRNKFIGLTVLQVVIISIFLYSGGRLPAIKSPPASPITITPEDFARQ